MAWKICASWTCADCGLGEGAIEHARLGHRRDDAVLVLHVSRMPVGVLLEHRDRFFLAPGTHEDALQVLPYLLILGVGGKILAEGVDRDLGVLLVLRRLVAGAVEGERREAQRPPNRGRGGVFPQAPLIACEGRPRRTRPCSGCWRCGSPRARRACRSRRGSGSRSRSAWWRRSFASASIGGQKEVFMGAPSSRRAPDFIALARQVNGSPSQCRQRRRPPAAALGSFGFDSRSRVASRGLPWPLVTGGGGGPRRERRRCSRSSHSRLKDAATQIDA